uniref:Transposase n=1 Tax=Knipowitschia caucasica TaxID=637954 RepID=A0AAV2JIB8_KNICA
MGAEQCDISSQTERRGRLLEKAREPATTDNEAIAESFYARGSGRIREYWGGKSVLPLDTKHGKLKCQITLAIQLPESRAGEGGTRGKPGVDRPPLEVVQRSAAAAVGPVPFLCEGKEEAESGLPAWRLMTPMQRGGGGVQGRGESVEGGLGGSLSRSHAHQDN